MGGGWSAEGAQSNVMRAQCTFGPSNFHEQMDRPGAREGCISCKIPVVATKELKQALVRAANGKRNRLPVICIPNIIILCRL